MDPLGPAILTVKKIALFELCCLGCVVCCGSTYLFTFNV